MKNWHCYLGGVVLLFAGVFVGLSTAGSDKYAQGRLSACNDMLSVMNQMNPILSIMKTECVPYKGDAAIKIGSDLYSLDGKNKLN